MDIALKAVAFGTWSFVTSGAVAMLGSLGYSAWVLGAVFSSSQLGQVAYEVAPAFGVGGTVVPVMLAVVRLRREKERRPAYRQLEEASLRGWLTERYGIEVTDAVLGQLVTLVHDADTARTVEFTDTHGTALKMEYAAGHGWLVVENADTRGLHDYQPDGSTAQLEAADSTSAPQPEVQAETLLRGEAPVLHEGYQALLRTVRALDLSTEQQHTVKRVQQDMAATLALLRKAVKLGGPDAEQQAEIVRIIAELIEELQALVAEQREAVTRDLRVQRTYVAERKQVTGKLRLPVAGEQAAPGVDSQAAAQTEHSSAER